jgi:hypothetical protein
LQKCIPVGLPGRTNYNQSKRLKKRSRNIISGIPQRRKIIY